jgi:propane monooxygenase coupling protein
MTETVQSTEFGAVNRTSSNMCGVTLMNNQNGYVVAEIMGRKDGVVVSEYPSMIRVDGTGSITFDFDEITDALGSDFDQSDFEEIMSTHYGRMVHFDDKTMLFANPEDAAEYIDFDLKVV